MGFKKAVVEVEVKVDAVLEKLIVSEVFKSYSATEEILDVGCYEWLR